MEAGCTKGGHVDYYTTENPQRFKEGARIFISDEVHVNHLDLE